ncbi:tyrosine-type recombinase/integrase [Aerococcaceae bacterium DSM 109653]|uniref:Tyrosine-type recombinase/integrase n=1 Tax=Fundicoccus ignavus TaxID=2664442 RepID=A0A844BZD2_9LACT|nr:site-specific integrase [Fundicoccus ignavus]MRI80721.1 tyrosine-type recombinase/integrase [Fundicoccus ignavus]
MATFKEYKTKNGVRWSVRGYLGTSEATGTQQEYKKQGFKTKKEAQINYNRAKVEFERGVYATLNNTYTYEEVYEEWLEQYKLDVKDGTLAKTKRIFNKHILPTFGNIKIKNVSDKLLQDSVNKWHNSFAMYRTVYNYCIAVLNYAASKGYIYNNPSQRVIVPNKELEYNNYTTNKKKFYDKQELQLFLEKAKEYDPMWFTFFRLLSFTGLRKGEALALTWNDISLKEATVTVNKTISRGENNEVIINSPKSKASNRTVSIDGNTLNVLKTWRKQQAEYLIAFGHNAMQPQQLVFSWYKDNGLIDQTMPKHKMVKICVPNNIELITPHGFRHTHCSLLFDAGVPMKDVMKRLGHSKIATTMNIYTHVTKDSEKKSAELFANYVNF